MMDYHRSPSAGNPLMSGFGRAEQLKLGAFDCSEWKAFRDNGRP
jgi:hypothetical protein